MIRFKSFIGIIKILISCLFWGIIFQQPGWAQEKTEPSLTLNFQAPIESPVEFPPGKIPPAGDQLIESIAQDGEVPLPRPGPGSAARGHRALPRHDRARALVRP